MNIVDDVNVVDDVVNVVDDVTDDVADVMGKLEPRTPQKSQPVQ